MKDECQRIQKEARALMVLPLHFPGEEAEKKNNNCSIAMAQSKFTTALAERRYCVLRGNTNVKEMTEPWNQIVCSGEKYRQRDENFHYACTVTILDTRNSHLLCLLINTFCSAPQLW